MDAHDSLAEFLRAADADDRFDVYVVARVIVRDRENDEVWFVFGEAVERGFAAVKREIDGLGSEQTKIGGREVVS